MKTILYAWLIMLCITPAALVKAQETGEPLQGIKKFDEPLKLGDARLTGIRHEVKNNFPCVIYQVELETAGEYVLQSFGNFSTNNPVYVTVAQSGDLPSDLDPGRARYALKIGEDGWQSCRATSTDGTDRIHLPAGKSDLYLFTKESDFALSDRISISANGYDPEYDENVSKIKNFIDEQTASGPSDAPKEAEPRERRNPNAAGDYSMVIPNPQGNYSHQVNENFNYSTFTYIYLTAGSVITLETSNTVGGTSDPVVHLFDPNNPDARSWTDDDSGPGLESKLTVFIPATANYVLLVRPYSDNVSGTTKVWKNGGLYLNNTPIGGRRFTHVAYSGTRNFFTAYMTGDTRLFTLNSVAGNVRGYNDDYWGPGAFPWGLRSRVTKNFPTSINSTYICAYSTSVYSSGVTDTYMGNPNGAAYSWFPNYNVNDCIQSAPSSFVYNCISWSGGITGSWKWPPSDPLYAAGTELGTFDKFYKNTPARYTGAWNYTRAGANVGNAVIDLWKVGTGATGYTHASVKKPGNNNPHGYDWESKPGSLDRCFHPRNALNGPDYGAVTDYYIFDGTFARSVPGKELITCDADAVRLGYDVYDDAKLSNAAQLKLTSLLSQTSPSLASEFARLYEVWKATWGKFAGASDPNAYAKNNEYDMLLNMCKRNGEAVLPLLFSRYIQGDFISTPLLWTLTQPKYLPLIEEVKQDILSNPNDAQGRYIIRSTFGNNVLYIEKILRDLQAAPAFTVTVSPNPVSDRMNVDVTITAESKVTVNITSSRTNAKISPARETKLAAGTHRFTVSTRQIAGGVGDIILVQVQVNETTQTVKAVVGQ